MYARYVLSRIGQSVFVLWAAYTISFVLLYILPSDAVDLLFDPTRLNAEFEAEKDRIRAYYGLDQPAWLQYLTQLSRVVTGDLGISVQTGEPVASTILDVLPPTLALAVCSLAVAVILAFLLALTAVSTGRPWLARLLKAIPPTFVSVPIFIIGLVLMQVFSFQLHWFPSIGDTGVQSLVLPVLTLAIPTAGPLAYLLIRSSMIELAKPYAITAAAKGLRPHQVIWRDVLRNAALPALTLAGLTFGNLLAGAIIVETVFSRSGVGRLSEMAVRAQDIPVVQGVVLFGAVVFVCVNLIVDLLYPLLDPKLRADIAAGRTVAVPRATKAKVS